jgi:thiamine biosynthesis lipoprotein
MTISLHTGVRTATVSTGWTAWDTPFRLVVTDPWAMHRARRLVEDQVGALVAAAGTDARSRDARLAELLGARARTGRVRPFPYGIAGAPAGVDVHRAAPAPWQQVFASATRARDGWRVEPGPSGRALLAQRCAEEVAEVTSCGALVAFGDDVATSGLAPVGGWRVELRDAPGAEPAVVAVDGGAISSVSSVCAQRGDRLHPLVVPGSGRTVVPVWRSVAVAAADAADASAACSGALLRGAGAPAWLAGLGLPALLVDTAGTPHAVGSWPVPV